MIRTAFLFALLSTAAMGDTLLPTSLVCQTVGMQEEDGTILAFPSPGLAFALNHDGQDVSLDESSPLYGFLTMIAETWDSALERFLDNNSYRIVLLADGLTDTGDVVLLHYPVASVFEVGMRDNALVHHCRADTDGLS